MDAIDAILAQLTEEEQAKIRPVLLRDLEFQRKEKERIRQLQSPKRNSSCMTPFERKQSLKNNASGRQCSCCQQALGVFVNKGADCPNCRRLVCGNCRQVHQRNWMCVICGRERELIAASGQWFYKSSCPDDNNTSSASSSTSEMLLSQMRKVAMFRKSSAAVANRYSTDNRLSQPIMLDRPRSWQQQPSNTSSKIRDTINNRSSMPTSGAERGNISTSDRPEKLIASANRSGLVEKMHQSGNITITDCIAVQQSKSMPAGDSCCDMTLPTSEHQPPLSLITFLQSPSMHKRSTVEPSNANAQDSFDSIDNLSINSRSRQSSFRSQSTTYGGDDSDVAITTTTSSSHPTITGDIHLRLVYDYRVGHLNVIINRCRHLIDVKKSPPNPFVRVQLLSSVGGGGGGEGGRRKTRTKRHQNDPIFNETLQFSNLTKSELHSRIVHICVWHHNDFFGRNIFLGEVHIALSTYAWNSGTTAGSGEWYRLGESQEHDPPDPMQCNPPSSPAPIDTLSVSNRRGTLKFALNYTLSTMTSGDAKNLSTNTAIGGILFCRIISARLLPVESARAPFVKGRLFIDNKHSIRQCTSQAVPPNGGGAHIGAVYWNYTFSFHAQKLTDLSSRSLHLSVNDQHSIISGARLVGRIRLNNLTHTSSAGCECKCDECDVWRRMLSNANRWIEFELPLRG